MKTIKLFPNEKVEGATQRILKRFEKNNVLSPEDNRILSNAISDLILHGQSLFDQGASFKSTRKIKIDGKEVKIIADFRQSNFIRKILEKLR